jgi:hypothetical protein
MLRDSLKIPFLEAAQTLGLSEHAAALLAEARECVHLFYGNPGQELPVGASKVGGVPDLPDSID